eukprot:977661_1
MAEFNVAYIADQLILKAMRREIEEDQKNNRYKCIYADCGQYLVKVNDGTSLYNNGGCFCDLCRANIKSKNNRTVWHCDQNESHPGGVDICNDCIATLHSRLLHILDEKDPVAQIHTGLQLGLSNDITHRLRCMDIQPRLQAIEANDGVSIWEETTCVCGKELRKICGNELDYEKHENIRCMICKREGEPGTDRLRSTGLSLKQLCSIYWYNDGQYVCFNCCNNDDLKSEPSSEHPQYQQKCDHGIWDCPHLETLAQIIVEYANKPHELDSESVMQIVNNYHHLMHRHDTDEEFEFITAKLMSYLDCDHGIAQCRMFARNYRDRSAERTDIDHVSVHTQIIDKVHCYLSHCYDVGYRISENARNDTNDSSQEIDIDDEKYIPIAHYLTNKKLIQAKTIPSVNQKHEVQKQKNTKFNQLYARDKRVKPTKQCMIPAIYLNMDTEVKNHPMAFLFYQNIVH